MQPLIAVPATLALVYRAWSRKSLTPLGIFAATGTAIIHALHPWSAPFALLVVFFLGGTTATKVRTVSTCENGTPTNAFEESLANPKTGQARCQIPSNPLLDRRNRRRRRSYPHPSPRKLLRRLDPHPPSHTSTVLEAFVSRMLVLWW